MMREGGDGACRPRGSLRSQAVPRAGPFEWTAKEMFTVNMKKLTALLAALALCLAGLCAQAEELAVDEGGDPMRMMIGETPVTVAWEDNESVAALRALAAEGLTIDMSMYGGFEQVGPVGTRLPSSDVQTRTSAGDIVLYSSSQIVVFYGSNSWAYTRLGHITDRDPAGMAALLGSGDVKITISMEDSIS